MPPKKATTKSNVKSPKTKKRPDLKNLKFYEHTTEQKAVKYMAALLHRKPKHGWPTDEELALVQSSLLPPPTPRGLRPYATDALLSDAAICVDDAKLDRPRSWNTSGSAYVVREGYSASYPPALDDFDMLPADSLVPPPLSLEVGFETAHLYNHLDISKCPATTIPLPAPQPESRVQHCEWAHPDDDFTHKSCKFCLNPLYADNILRSGISDHLSQSGLKADFVGGKSSWYRCRWKDCDKSHYEPFLFDDLVEHVLHSHYKT
ncbi:hypothetical protein K523DRAFT_418108 [Schizophyllum commune Tattone D]|nr:hypothetical protein K523DRAFT_418108 [Schizophyllum commune Tattone D]